MKRFEVYYEFRSLKRKILHIDLLPNISLTFDAVTGRYKQCSIMFCFLLFCCYVDINYKINEL